MKIQSFSLLLLATLLIGASATVYEFDLNDSTHLATLESGLTVEVGDQIRVVVNENPTTGYKWQYEDTTQKNITVYSVSEDVYRAYTSSGRVLGQGGARVLTITVNEEGTENFEMVYVRSWEFEGFDSLDTSEYADNEYHSFNITVNAKSTTTA